MSDRPEPTPAPDLTNRQWKALREAQELAQRGGNMGARKIVSMQSLADRGLATPIYSRSTGLLAGWDLTEAGLTVKQERAAHG